MVLQNFLTQPAGRTLSRPALWAACHVRPFTKAQVFEAGRQERGSHLQDFAVRTSSRAGRSVPFGRAGDGAATLSWLSSGLLSMSNQLDSWARQSYRNLIPEFPEV